MAGKITKIRTKRRVLPPNSEFIWSLGNAECWYDLKNEMWKVVWPGDVTGQPLVAYYALFESAIEKLEEVGS